MSEPSRPVLTPGPDHPITVDPSTEHVVVMVAGRKVADTHRALALREASYPVVYYISLDDVDKTLLEPTDHSTYCPYKGDASYYSIPVAGGAGENAVWTYEQPSEAVAAIKDHIAFYPDRVEITVS
jgi:uncharacterized protein (DUF427 family)